MAGFKSSMSLWHSLGHIELMAPLQTALASALFNKAICKVLICYSGPCPLLPSWPPSPLRAGPAGFVPLPCSQLASCHEDMKGACTGLSADFLPTPVPWSGHCC
jgi:hypothetical protein